MGRWHQRKRAGSARPLAVPVDFISVDLDEDSGSLLIDATTSGGEGQTGTLDVLLDAGSGFEIAETIPAIDLEANHILEEVPFPGPGTYKLRLNASGGSIAESGTFILP